MESEIYKLNTNNICKEIEVKYPRLFHLEPGCYNRGEITIEVQEGTKLIVLKARHVPYALKEKVENEIARLEKLGDLERVDSSEWATPVKNVINSNGQLRICEDFKQTLNLHIIMKNHPLPCIEDIFQILQRGKYYFQLDLTRAYMQMPVEVKSREFLTIATNLGYHRYTKVAEGIATGPGEFQKKIEECLRGIRGTIPYIDNIYVTGTTEKEHLLNLENTYKRLEESGLRLNKSKCEFLKSSIEVLGFIIDEMELHQAKSKIKAMVEAPRPIDTKQLQAFLGLINLYARFLPNRSENFKALYDCVSAEKFVWTDKCEKAYEWVKLK